MKRLPRLALASLALVALAACGALKYHGSGTYHASKIFSCDGGGEVFITLMGESGSLTVDVYEDGGARPHLFGQTFAPSAVERTESYEFPAQAGDEGSDWEVFVETNHDWKGKFEVTFECL
ncbi:MAG: hypothetical protein P1V51_00785 [Deltaproteobacteria bacterium]|nr:hypothetical protein [Deltaproteobacteria bacterium]